jgi:hypothetical protein
MKGDGDEKMRYGLIIFLLLVWPVSTQALTDFTGSKLLSFCEADQPSVNLCLFYIIGVSDGYYLGNYAGVRFRLGPPHSLYF